MIDPRWISSYLQSLDLEKINDPKPLILDLGSEMTSVEMDVFNRLSKKCDIYIIVPNPAWSAKYHFLLNTYKLNQGAGEHKKHIQTEAVESLDKNQFLRLSTQLAEVKWITQTVREWLDQGVNPDQIALLSPQVEKYWPSLSTHLEIEGIPVDKSVVTSLIATQGFQNLIAAIQAFSSSLGWEDLEVSYVQNFEHVDSTTKSKNFEKFKALYIELTDVEDLARDENIKKLYYRKIDLQTPLTRDEFLAKVIDIISQQRKTSGKSESAEFQSRLEVIIKDFISKTKDYKFKFSDWFDLFKTLLGRKEIKIKNPQSEGIQIRDLGAVYLNQITHRIWFGLDDSVFQSSSKNLIPLPDIEILKNTFDFPLQYPEESHDEFNLRWLSMSKCEKQFFTCAHVSLGGEPLNTSIFILENNPRPDLYFHPATRLDQLQVGFQPLKTDKIAFEKTSKLNIVPDFLSPEISGTDVINYSKCGFKLLASKGFRLRDYSVVSVDLDHMQKGTLAHDLFEYLVTDKLYQTVGRDQIADYLEEKRQSFNLFPNDDLFWGIQKNKFIQIGFRFSENEKKRLGADSLQHLLEFDFMLPILEFQIKGRIDRIDIDPQTNEQLIYDYKRTDSTSNFHHDKWISEKEYQMLFYLLALADKAEVSKIRGAVYYFYQKLKVNKGLYIQGNAQFDEQIEVKKNMKCETGQLETLLSDFKVLLKDVFQKLKTFDYTAQPEDTDICQTCDWRRLCRAPHLN
jgi:ATP-dependent helicase/nuclease subunit B